MAGLQTPLQVRGFELRNRIFMPPMANNAAGPNGEVTPKLLDHYRRHAAGGSSAIVVEHSYVTPEGRLSPGQLAIDDDGLIPGLADLATAIRTEGPAALIQMTHGGSRCPVDLIGTTPVGPSAMPFPGTQTKPRGLTAGEIDELTGLFARAAGRAREAGFDGVEIHAAHGFLLNEFLSPLTNTRDDDYGADLERRARWLGEVIQAVRQAMGDEIMLWCRFPVQDGLPGGLTPEAAAETARMVETAGLDLLDCSGGLSGSRPAGAGRGYFVAGATAVKKAVSIPVAVAGGIDDPEYADGLIRNGLVDAVCVGRAQLSAPDWPRKALAALGR